MKRKIIYILFLFVSFSLTAQNKHELGYRIVDDYVIFTFDVRDYSKFTNDESGRKLDFEDFDIENVVVAGEFNKWSRDNWEMHKIGKYTYEFKKNLSDFTDEFTWEFKFVINNKYWAEPNRKTKNIAPAKDEYGTKLHVYNLKMYTAYPDKNGNACFKLSGYKNARNVILSGTFNRWDEKLFKMERTEDGWELTLQLKPDEYQYKFIVDGNWIEDPDNPDKAVNEFEEYNSVINIKESVTFKLNGYLDASKVILSGSFNNWSENGYLMHRTDEGWTFTTNLSGGKHHYKFIVDGNWITDPTNSVREYDGDGHINSVLMVK